MYNKGTIFNIQRFSTSDGPGIRTVIFLKGCPLNCAWCHNPESKSATGEVFYKQELCIGCGACVNACENHCHTLSNGTHTFDRDPCLRCGKCTEGCYTKALEYCGEEKTVQEVLDVALRDLPFYEESGGGITISGGEPLMQYAFTYSLLKHAKAQGLHTAIETSGFSHQDLAALNEYVDLWLYDVKLLSKDQHIQYTGASNEIILDNLSQLGRIGANIILRCPVIPDVNMTYDHLDGLAKLANDLPGVAAIHLEPYHPLGLSKAQQLGKQQNYPNGTFLDASQLIPFVSYLQSKTDTPVLII